MLGAEASRPRVTKNQKATIKMLPGHVARVRVRCGKPNCRCSRGARHVAHYRVWHSDGARYRQYVKLSDVEATRAACEEYRQPQAELRVGRARYRIILAYVREVFGR